jgi:hypothetical protein
LEQSTEIRVSSLAALREAIETAPPETLLYHVVRIGLRYPRARELPPHDFARWVEDELQDPEAAERLSFAGAPPYESLEELRARLLAAIGTSPRRREVRDDDARLGLLALRLIPVPLDLEAATPTDLVALWPTLGHDCIWYHLVDSALLPRHAPDALLPWLEQSGAPRLAASARDALRAPRSAAGLHADIRRRWRRSEIARRLVERADRPRGTGEPGEQGTVSRIVGRIRGGESPDVR